MIRKLVPLVCVLALGASVTVGSRSAHGWQSIDDGCLDCHGDTSLHDHQIFIGDCGLCHLEDRQAVPSTTTSEGTAFNEGRGCSGCHDSRGLALLHPSGEGCTDCHTDPPPPEGTEPPYFGSADTVQDDACSDNLDNDGDGLIDTNDPDCLDGVGGAGGAGGAGTVDAGGAPSAGGELGIAGAPGPGGRATAGGEPSAGGEPHAAGEPGAGGAGAASGDANPGGEPNAGGAPSASGETSDGGRTPTTGGRDGIGSSGESSSDGDSDADDDGGCGCRTAGQHPPIRSGLTLLILGLTAVFSRRRSRR